MGQLTSCSGQPIPGAAVDCHPGRKPSARRGATRNYAKSATPASAEERDFQAPRLRAYPRETVVAEKREAMVQLGIANSRMKDFYDVAVLARDFDFDGALLARAVRATFDRRKTTLPTTTPVALTPAFAEDATKKTQWSGFVRKAGVRDAGSLAETIADVRAFVEAPASAANGPPAPGTWRAGVAWG